MLFKFSVAEFVSCLPWLPPNQKRGRSSLGPFRTTPCQWLILVQGEKLHPRIFGSE